MFTTQPKKALIMNILDILWKYTDEKHRLSQKEIINILKNEYCMTADRKAIRRNISALIECGYQIEYNETVRFIPGKSNDPEESYMWSDFYLVHDFTEGELRLLIDGLLFSQHIPYSQCRELTEKLKKLSSTYFRSHVKHIVTMPRDSGDNRQIFYNIEQLDEAIENNRKVSFKYADYGADKKLHKRRRPDGTEREYIISPYQMAAREGKYYLICNYDKYDDISNYRIDRICDLIILDEQAKPFSALKWANGRSLDLQTYMKEHPYMYASETVRTKLRIKSTMIGDIIDIFGKDVRFSDESDNEITVTVYAGELATEQFARSYAPDVIVLEPQSLADKIRISMEESVQKYKANMDQ